MTYLKTNKNLFHKAIILFICCNSYSLLAQKDTSIIQHLEIHTNPLTFGYYNPSYRLGVEYVKNQLGYVVEYGFGNTALNGYRFNATEGKQGNQYLYNNIRLEFKYYLKKLKQGRNVYVSSELFLMQVTDVIYNSYYVPVSKDSYTEYSFTKADFLHQKYGVNLKIGGKRIIKNRIIMDGYMGVGIVKYVVDYSNIENQKPSEPTVTDGFPFFPNYSKETNSIKLDFIIGLKLGYILWKN
tara:strand:- start:32130 stop:32849 length:720 start_codon:yes stop_codon:yes gene_type:complete